MPRKFFRTIRLDESDSQVYALAAHPGEWAVPGSFAFLDIDPQTLSGKQLQAFKSGFLGTKSFGWSTLVEIADIDDDEYQHVVDRLAAHLIEAHGAPHLKAALPAAGGEAEYTVSLCAHEAHTLLALEREFSDEGIVESLKVFRPDASDHSKMRLWGVPDE